MKRTQLAVFACGIGLSLGTLPAASTGNAATETPPSGNATTAMPPAANAAKESATVTAPEAGQWKRMSLEELMNVEVKDVTTASKFAEKATDAPATVLVITAQDIKLRGYRFLYEVLRDVPGMETAPMFFSEVGTQVAVRGLVGNNKIVVLVNGMRVNPPGGENFMFRSDFSVRDAEQIEIMYGAGSTLYGQDAISAVINIITRKPTENPGGTVGADGGLNYERDAWGSFSDSFGADKNIRFLGYVSYHDSEMMRINKEYPSYWDQYSSIAANANPPGLEQTPTREDYGLNAFARLEVGKWASLQVWQRNSERSSSEGGYGYVENGSFVPVLHYLPQAIWNDMSTVVEGKITLPIGDTAKLESTVTYNRYEIDPNTRYVWPASSPTSTNWYFNDYKYGIGEGLTFEETLHWDVTPKVQLLTGFFAGLYDVIPKSTVPGGADPNGDVVAQGGYWEYYTTQGDLSSIHRIPRVVEVRYQTYAGYVEAGWQALDKLRLIAGVRVTGDTRYEDIPVTPRASVIYEMTKELTAKYIFTKAFVAPAPYFAYATYDNGTVLATSNPDIHPETALTQELDLTYTRKNLMLGISGYYGTQDNLILISDTAAPQNVIQQVWVGPAANSPRILSHSANGGSSERFGFDVYGRATFGPVSPWASYSYVGFSEDLPSGTIGLQGISRHNGRVGATWAVTPRLFITPSIVVRSTPENVFVGTLGGAVQNPFEMNLYVLWNVFKHVDVFADLRNITDTHNALTGVSGVAYPQETFSGVFGVQISF